MPCSARAGCGTMVVMERRAAGRALHFAVTGALLGSGLAVVGCRTVTETPPTNTGPMNEPQPVPEAPDHVNEGPVEEPAADEPASPDADVNPGPQPEPEPEHINTKKVSEP